MIGRLLLLAGLILSAGLPAAYAQDISGAWSFKTEIKRKGCKITGNMSISPTNQSGIQTCSFVSSETCLSAPEVAVKMDQACRITPQGDSYIIRSKVIGTLTDGYDPRGYLADHFVVKPSTPTEMHGIWQDARFSATVIFWRDDALPVS